jgi:AcrR family transcriptional regulator
MSVLNLHVHVVNLLDFENSNAVRFQNVILQHSSVKVKRRSRNERCSGSVSLLAMGAPDDQLSPPPPPTTPDPIPEPPWRVPARPRTEPRVPLTREAIVEAALRVLDREGMDGLSMHRVAHELGTGAGSLYWHVRNKGELLQLLSERLAAEIELPDPDPARWQEQLKDIGRQMRAGAQRHRDGARITLGRVPSGPTLARFAEWLFELMTPIGVPDRVIAYLGDMVSLYVGAYAFEETSAWRHRQARTCLPSGSWRCSATISCPSRPTGSRTSTAPPETSSAVTPTTGLSSGWTSS